MPDRESVTGSAANNTGARREEAADPALPMRVSIILQPQNRDLAQQLSSGNIDPSHPPYTGASEQAVSAVEEFAKGAGLNVEKADATTRTVVVSGPADRIGQAFGASLGWYLGPENKRYLSYDGELTLPPSVRPYVLAVLGLSTKPAAQPR